VSHKRSSHTILAIAPSSRGFGFAVLEGKALVDWGCRGVKGDKNAATVTKIRNLISFYTPTLLIIQDYSAKPTRRSERIRLLGIAIASLAADCGLPLKLVPHVNFQRVFFGKGKGTKHEIAQVLATRFPEELGPLLPPERKPWMPQHPRTDMFDAIALAISQATAAQ